MHDFTKALCARDIDAIRDSLSASVTYYSPVMRKPLAGAGVFEIMEIFCEVVSPVHVTEEFGTAETLVLVGDVTVGSSTGDATWVLRLNDDGKVRQISWQARPFKTVVNLASAFAAGLARRRGGAKPALVAIGKPVNLLVAHTVDWFSPLLAPPARRPAV